MPSMKTLMTRWAPVALVALLTACSGADPDASSRDAPAREEANMAKTTHQLKIASEAFTDQGRIPREYTCEGEDVSPALSWDQAPSGTVAWALITDDPDAPKKTWVHWVVYDIPAATNTLPRGVPEGELPGGGMQGKNDFGNLAYGGPCPPPGHGPHHYHFKLYALDRKLALDPGATKEQVLNAMKDHVLAEGELIGVYERK